MATILIVEDDLDNRETLAKVVEILGYQIVLAASAEEALRLLDKRDDVVLVLCDIRLPGMDGIEFKAAARKLRPKLRIAYLTGDSQAADDAIESGALAMLKPYDFTLLTRVIVEALEKPPAN